MDKESLTFYCRALRADVLDMIWQSQYGFLGSCFSCIELLVAAIKAAHPTRRCPISQLVLSKGHAAPVLYAALQREGHVVCHANAYAAYGTGFEGHPNALLLPDVAVSTGSLGLGLAVAVGRALAAKIEGLGHPITVIAGDAEFQEGIVWEAMHIAGRLQLSNLLILVDCNGMQSVGAVPSTIDIALLSRSAGCESFTVDGHSVPEIARIIDIPQNDSPRVILGKTQRGYGFLDYPQQARMSWLPSKDLYERNIQQLQD